MPNHCSITIFGHIGQDPKMQELPSGAKVCNASIAYNAYGQNRDGSKKDTVWFTLTIWGKQGERFCEWFKAGDLAVVSGELDNESWDHQGERRSKLVIKVGSFSGMGKEKGDDAPAARRQAKAKQSQDTEDAGDVPF